MALGEMTVKVVPDVSGIEPAIRAELDRINSNLSKGEVNPNDFAEALSRHWHSNGGDWENMAGTLLDEFVITRRGNGDNA